MYPIQLTQPMADELKSIGFQSIQNPEDVKQALENAEGTTLLVVNSVCGCAAANARPGVRMALDQGKKPNHLVTVFAGVDTEATKMARNYLAPYPPSSPSIALFKDGKLVHFLERHNIEGKSAHIIANNLIDAFETFC
ncbi:MAG: BrxA/BrxB family bacilliredoxin [Saprospiraceae bacterium]|jgi:putative YphP/YqiW family bacilliredoxin|nr:BrxA/BrxB family bacilliredoxin [Saprospiraceae bacterium]MCA0334711.1 BrxA/BrxB family bacilliredoxin [Bacteroidota bacterium]MCB0603948.1 BrxA/BrxB family bacilliredoxin [Saprospiraceae bacterium]HMT77396.1 BrxA/BrxB family bacilliredoxin [Saprospiraceae bacterium]HQU95010.1 BrxA/BrxB family bacilliredoxin [Saprospiraceae bacterium]